MIFNKTAREFKWGKVSLFGKKKIVWEELDTVMKNMFLTLGSHYKQNYFEMNHGSSGRQIFLSWDRGSINHTKKNDI